MADSQLLGILLLAMVAGIILFRLYTVLGRRTGNEREPQDLLRRVDAAATAASDNQRALPDRSAASASQQTDGDDAIEEGLAEIKQADRGFDANHFLEGAREAYRLVVTAFAARDRDALRPLLSDDVYNTFDAEIHEHEARKETVNYALIGFSDVRIVHADLRGRIAEITVRFATQFVSSTTNDSGAIVEGDSKAVRDIVDVWTFDRDTRSGDPNWKLIATASGS